MTIVTKLHLSLFLALALIFAAPAAGPVSGMFGVTAAQAQTINRISVQGNQRVDDATVISYLTVRVGSRATRAELSASQSALLASGLFSSATVSMSGNTLRVAVSENSIVGSVLFEGNNALSDNELNDMVDLSRRGTFTQARLETDIRTIEYAYDRRGFENVKVTARTENTSDGRIRVVFVVNEGNRAGIAAINFSGNNAYDSGFLKSLISTKESHLLSWLFRDDALDEDRLTVDGETIRQYYVNHGYPDAQILSAVSEFDEAQNAYFVSFTISEGEYYEFAGIGIETSIPGLDTEALKSVVRTYEGDTFSARKIAASSEEMAVRAAAQGYAFADVRARLNRDTANKEGG
jgi:outer membrane protein insertion porin family